MSKYVDGFVIPVKKKDMKAYKKMATLGCKVWMEYGALDYYECVGDELKNPWGIPFSKLCKLKAGETVVFAFIIYKSKAHRNAINKKIHKDPRMAPEKFPKMPFEMKRFSSGGFKVFVQSK
jgi:alkaline phosphatase